MEPEEVLSFVPKRRRGRPVAEEVLRAERPSLADREVYSSEPQPRPYVLSYTPSSGVGPSVSPTPVPESHPPPTSLQGVPRRETPARSDGVVGGKVVPRRPVIHRDTGPRGQTV